MQLKKCVIVFATLISQMDVMCFARNAEIGIATADFERYEEYVVSQGFLTIVELYDAYNRVLRYLSEIERTVVVLCKCKE